MLVGRNHLASLLTGDFRSPLAVSWRSPCIVHGVGLSPWGQLTPGQLASIRASQWDSGLAKRKLPSHAAPSWRWQSHRFCHIVLVRRKAKRSSSLLMGTGWHKAVTITQWGSQGTLLEAAPGQKILLLWSRIEISLRLQYWGFHNYDLGGDYPNGWLLLNANGGTERVSLPEFSVSWGSCVLRASIMIIV